MAAVAVVVEYAFDRRMGNLMIGREKECEGNNNFAAATLIGREVVGRNKLEERSY